METSYKTVSYFSYFFIFPIVTPVYYRISGVLAIFILLSSNKKQTGIKTKQGINSYEYIFAHKKYIRHLISYKYIYIEKV